MNNNINLILNIEKSSKAVVATDNIGNGAIHLNPQFAKNVHFNPKFLNKTKSSPESSTSHSQPFISTYDGPQSKFKWKRNDFSQQSKFQYGNPTSSKTCDPLFGGKYIRHSSYFHKQSIKNYASVSSSYFSKNNIMDYKKNSNTFDASKNRSANSSTSVNHIDSTKNMPGTTYISVNKRKLIRKVSSSPIRKTLILQKSPPNKLKTISKHNKSVYFSPSKTKFKIDKRPPIMRKSPKWKNIITKSRYKIENLFPRSLYHVNKYSFRRQHAVAPKVTTSPLKQRQKVSKRLKFGNRKVVNIGGILYRVSSHKITRSNTVAAKEKETKKGIKKSEGHIIQVRGERFVLSNNGATLKRVPDKTKVASPRQRVDFGGVTYRQMSDNVLVRTDSHRTRSLLLQAKHRSIATLTSKRRKINTPCVIFNKVGKCQKMQRGICPYTHDKKNVALCKRFLQGTCDDKNCLLSHDVVHQKVATCHYFLKGVCVRENCPYLHVKVNRKAAICGAFLQGYCILGNQCSKRHVNLCPNFDETGECKRGEKCPYPHKIRKKCIDLKKKWKKPIVSSTKNNKKTTKIKENKRGPQACVESEETSTGRYYESGRAEFASGGRENNIEIVPERTKLEELPSFIGLNLSKTN